MQRRSLQKQIWFVIAGALLTAMSAFSATNYYVDGVHGLNTNTGLDSAHAKLTIQAAANLTNPGDTVFIMNGTYTAATNSQYIVEISRAGTDGQYIVYKAKKGHSPKLAHSVNVTWGVWFAVHIEASYIVVDGLEVQGNNASLTYEGGYQTWQDYENNIKDWTKIAKYNAGCICIGEKTAIHHIVIRNCTLHDAGGGVGVSKADYVTIDNNIVYNNCWYSMYAGSGISIFGPVPIDDVTSYKMFIRNNIVYNNKCLVPWESSNGLSDGNGIILDANNGTQGKAVYTGRTLVENNVSYNNGGGGVHCFQAARVDIINNTAYNNGTVVGYPEIDGQSSTDIKIYNNIMYARSETGARCNGNDAGATYDYNLYFNGLTPKKGTHDVIADPQFVKAALDSSANFRVQSTSPAINTGSNTAGQFSAKDILGVSRPVGALPDKGAYEYTSTGINNQSGKQAVRLGQQTGPKKLLSLNPTTQNSSVASSKLYDVSGRNLILKSLSGNLGHGVYLLPTKTEK